MHPIQDDPSLHRLELLGTLARAARLALADHESADSVSITLTASPQGLEVDVMLTAAGLPVAGWGN